jgi:two-component system phosphate regulon response regulator PhoB
MSETRILVVDDEPDIRELIRYNLQKEGYRVTTAATGEVALKAAGEQRPDAIVLDLMLPGIGGIEVCRRLKRDDRTRLIPVVMLTAKTEETDVVTGLEAGADDYVTKPFSPRVLTARVKAMLRRTLETNARPEEDRIAIHGITIDRARHEVRIGERQIQLSATEFAILEFLSKNPGWVFSRAKIIDAIRGKDYPVTERAVDVQILGLRKKLGELGKLVETVRAVGYRMRGR